MSLNEYSNELYNAIDNIRDSFWLDDVADDVETVMWYAGLTEEFLKADFSEWDELLKKAQEILNINLGK